MTKPSRLPHHLRIAALQCNFEGGPTKTLLVPGLWKHFGFNVEQLLHTHAELYSAVFDRRRHGTLLRRYLAESRKHGLATILYMNCHILLDSQKGRIRDWAAVRKDGTYARLYETYYGCCVNSSWTDFFLKAIADLKDYDLAGIFFDGPSTAPCYCPRCRARFKAERGKSLQKAALEEAAEFGLESSLNFMARAYAKVKETNPGRLAYFNTPVLHSDMTGDQIRRALACNDIVGTEGGFQFYGPPKDVDIWRCGLNARAVEAVAGDRPRVIFMAGDHKPWSWYLHTPAETRLCYASALANGASVWYGIHCRSANLSSPAGRAARDMIQFDRRHDGLYQDATSLADVAMLYSFNTAKHYTSSGEATDFYHSDGRKKAVAIGNYWESFNGAAGLLFHAGIPFDLVTELDTDALRRYRVLVVPTGACLADATAEAIRTFIRGGGTLIADSETSLFDETGIRRRDFHLADVFGASFEGHRRYAPHDYLALDPRLQIPNQDGVPLIPAPLMALNVTPARQAKVLGRLCPPLPGRYAGEPGRPIHPFLIRQRTGKGQSYYLAGTFFELYRKFGIVHYRRLVGQLVRQHARPPVELIGAPESVEVTVRRAGAAGPLLVHLVNYTGGMTRPIAKVVPLRGLFLKVHARVKSARSLVAGRRLVADRNGLIVLPNISEFEVIAVTTG